MSPTQLPTSEVLNLAANLIEERGWVHGGGWPGEADFGGEDLGLCLEGGIMAALGVDMHTPNWTPILKSCPAYQAVAEHLAVGVLFIWNDTSGRTASEVIEVLRATALVEAAREDAALLAEAGRS